MTGPGKTGHLQTDGLKDRSFSKKKGYLNITFICIKCKTQTQDFLQALFTTRSINKKQYIKRYFVHNHSNSSSNMLGHWKKEHALELEYQHNILVGFKLELFNEINRIICSNRQFDLQL
ncbi:hypothetical protein BpHYR1_006291 [Brachionus plicatilis]|uniref:Uncharacterized protein n=1 Tax=Brachionus plicatilis TaxID=10195 RepID=A0A3M7RF65_BRAPC|nr:hypothetical protein BpHYR1_006291 [Brachionus plicatilis]